jgi:hypothetical protein
MRRQYDPSRWGGWRRVGHGLGYPRPPNKAMYVVDLERFTASSVMLDFIMQVAKKTWATDECLAGLVRALNEIIEPQAHLCSGWTDKRLTPGQLQQILRLSWTNQKRGPGPAVDQQEWGR